MLLLILQSQEQFSYKNKYGFVSTHKKRQSKKKLLGQLDDFDQDIVVGNADRERQENVLVNEGTNDRDFTVGTTSDNSLVIGNAMNVKTLEGVSLKKSIEK